MHQSFFGIKQKIYCFGIGAVIGGIGIRGVVFPDAPRKRNVIVPQPKSLRAGTGNRLRYGIGHDVRRYRFGKECS